MLTEECTFKTTDVDKPWDWSQSDEYHGLLTHPGERMSTPSGVNEEDHTDQLSSTDILIFGEVSFSWEQWKGYSTPPIHALTALLGSRAVGQD